jgi:uncharacterized delta-60 repeat protein
MFDDAKVINLSCPERSGLLYPLSLLFTNKRNGEMILEIKQTNRSNGERVSRLPNMLVMLIVTLAIILSIAISPRVVSVSGSSGPNSLTAVAGDLDLTFGVDGTVTTDLGNNLNDSATAVAAQPDGKVVVVGYASTSSTGRDFAVIRLNQNGTLDTTFSDGGKLTFNFNSATRDDIARAVAVQPDGKILIAGEADVLGFGNLDIALARLNVDGTFDASFGNNGKVATNLPNNRPDYGRSLVLQPDGKILVAGYSNRPTTGDDFVVVRYGSNGSLDTSFDGDGIVTTDILTNREDRAASIALEAGGKIVVAGYTNDPSFKNNFAIVRYNTNGSLDSTFNGTGKVNTDLNLNSEDYGYAVAVQTNGQIVVAGESASDFGLVRYNSNGSLDSTFGGGDGIVTTNFGTNSADTGRGVAVQTDGKIIITGKSRTELAAARYNTDGTTDTTFGNNGLLVQNAGNNQLSPNGGYFGMALQSDGKIVAVGDGWRDFSLNDFTISRININGTFDFSLGGGDGIASTDFFGRNDEAADIAIQSDGKIVAAGRVTDLTGANKVGLSRYNTDGTLDSLFGANGFIVTDILQHDFEDTRALAIQSDGKMLVAGSAKNPSTLLNDGYLVRYNTNGTLDSSFGTGGVVITPGNLVGDGNVWLYPYDIALQPDGKIIVAGLADYISVYGDGYVARYNSNGTLDNTFITNIPNHTPNGSIVLNFGNNYNVINAVTLQSDSKIVVTGWTNEASPDLALARINPNGSFDTSFDGDGKLTTDFGNNTSDIGNDVEIQSDGKIIAVGRTDINFIDMAVARYNPNGSLDASFGGGSGKLHIDFNAWADICSNVALQPDGKIILGGYADLERNSGGFALVRLTPSGAFDTSFGNGTGRLITNLGEGVNTGLEYAVNDMVLQSDGKIILAGASNFNSTGRDFTILRYENNLPCAYALDPLGTNFSDAGGSGSFDVITPTACAWMAQSNVTWISITSGASGSGNGTASYSVAANTDSTPRTGTVTVADQTLTITQSAVGFTLRIDNVSPKAGRVAGGQTITLTGAFAGLSTVTIGGTAVSWSYTSGTSVIAFTSPAHAVGAVDIILTPTSGNALTKSNAFAYLPTVFTDDTLVVGATTAKAQHIIELRQAVDALRAVAGLSAATWTDAGLPAGTSIKAVHITELRARLEEAAAQLGFSAASYTDPSLTASYDIKRIHIEELRQRIRAIAG